MTPNKKQLKHLLSLCHELQPVVRIGQKGVTDAVLAELDIALAHHELIKIKVSAADREARKGLITSIAQERDAHVIQQIGQTAVLFKRNHERPMVFFPKS
jgi:RNA-binding protein